MDSIEYAIETRSLSFGYNKNNIVLKNFTLQVPTNSIYGLLGKNGAGKTTLLRLILGLIYPGKERVFINSKELNDNSPKIKLEIGTLVEKPCLYEHLTAWEHLYYLKTIFAGENDRIAYILDLINLSGDTGKKVCQFSYGMKQKLALGMALFHDPKILILDEPTNGLDPTSVYELRQILKRLNGENKTILVSSHILSEVERLCDHIGILHHGELVFQGTLNQLKGLSSDIIEVETADNESFIKILKEQSYTFKLKNNLVEILLKEEEIDSFIKFLVVDCGVTIKKFYRAGSLENYFLKVTQ